MVCVAFSTILIFKIFVLKLTDFQAKCSAYQVYLRNFRLNPTCEIWQWYWRGLCWTSKSCDKYMLIMQINKCDKKLTWPERNMQRVSQSWWSWADENILKHGKVQLLLLVTELQRCNVLKILCTFEVLFILLGCHLLFLVAFGQFYWLSNIK
jgi:hypothetical protein